MAVELSQEDKQEIGTGKAEKPSRVEKIRAALTEIENASTVPECVTATPGAFLWEFYKAWVENGGQDGGKNRNSIRRMRDVWLTGDHEVKSLHPKLTGKVRISKDDAKSLMSLFLGRWKFVGVKEGDWVLTPDGYAPFPCRDCQKLCEQLADAMYMEGSGQSQTGFLLPVRIGDTHSIAEGSNWEDIAKLYNDLDAHITLSRHNSTIGPTASEKIRLFWHFMNHLYESLGDKDTIFIWVVDIGVRQVEDSNAWKDFYNFEMLKTQFRAFASFDSEIDSDDDIDRSKDVTQATHSGIHDAFLRSIAIPEEGSREKRWNWLCDRTVIVIQNLRREEFDHLYAEEDQQVEKIRLRDIGVTTENILPSMIPHEWLKLRELRELYGHEHTGISNATLTVLLNFQSKENNMRPDAVRYFAHALSSEIPKETPLSSASRSRELPRPGEHYDDAMRLVYWAARHRLKSIREDQDDISAKEWAIATAYLANQGFRVIRLPEFMSIHRSPGE